MKKLMMAVLGLTCIAGMAVAGSIDSPGAPSAGSGMYTLQNLYDYLMSGTALTVAGSFQEPTAGPSSTMKTTKEIGDGIKGQFDLCDATAANVQSGKKFFCTQAGSWGVKTGSMSSGGGLLKTGQTSVYQTNDDGTYQKGTAFNYSWVDGTNAVQDNVTGLMWASSGTGAGCNGGSTLNWSSAIIWAEGLSFAGYTDWRLPNVTEIQTLFVRNASQGAPYINLTYFPYTVSSYYWSSTTYPVNADYAITPYFDRGVVGNTANKTSSYYYVRAVRGGE